MQGAFVLRRRSGNVVGRRLCRDGAVSGKFASTIQRKAARSEKMRPGAAAEKRESRQSLNQ